MGNTSWKCWVDPRPIKECPNYLEFGPADIIKIKRQYLVVAFDLLIMFLILFLIACVVIYFYPAMELALQIFQLGMQVGSYLETGIAYFFSLWNWFASLIFNALESFTRLTGANSAIYWLLALELCVFSILYVMMGFQYAYQKFIDSTIFEVFYFLNTPFRWIRVNILESWFGTVLGNILALFFVPIEAFEVLLAVPIGFIIWLFRSARDSRD